MEWFRNRKTAAKFMIGFSIMAVLMAIVGFQRLEDANTLNLMIDDLYTKHMVGAASVHEARALIPSIGREVRQLLLDADPAGKEQDRLETDRLFNSLEDSLSAAEKNLVSAEGKAEMA